MDGADGAPPGHDYQGNVGRYLVHAGVQTVMVSKHVLYAMARSSTNFSDVFRPSQPDPSFSAWSVILMFVPFHIQSGVKRCTR